MVPTEMYERQLVKTMAASQGLDTEPFSTTNQELLIAINNHLVHSSKGMLQEPVIVLRGLSLTGVTRFFTDLPVRCEAGALVAEIDLPAQMKLLRLERHRGSRRNMLGNCKLQRKAFSRVARRMLVIGPPFVAWWDRMSRRVATRGLPLTFP